MEDPSGKPRVSPLQPEETRNGGGFRMGNKSGHALDLTH